MLALRLTRFEHLVDVNRVGALSGFTRENGTLVVHAATRQRVMERDPAIGARRRCWRGRRRSSSLPDPQPWHGRRLACARRSRVRVPRGRGRARAEIELAGPGGARRRVAAGDFFVGTWTTAAEPDEIVVAARFPVWPAGSGSRSRRSPAATATSPSPVSRAQSATGERGSRCSGRFDTGPGSRGRGGVADGCAGSRRRRGRGPRARRARRRARERRDPHPHRASSRRTRGQPRPGGTPCSPLRSTSRSTANGGARSSTRDSPSPTSCARTARSPEPISAASTACAARARCCSTRGRAIVPRVRRAGPGAEVTTIEVWAVPTARSRRCRTRSARSTACSAASARPASSCR